MEPALLGEWRSLVAHSAGGRAVAGSNPVSPIFESPLGKRAQGNRIGGSPRANRSAVPHVVPRVVLSGRIGCRNGRVRTCNYAPPPCQSREEANRGVAGGGPYRAIHWTVARGASSAEHGGPLGAGTLFPAPGRPYDLDEATSLSRSVESILLFDVSLHASRRFLRGRRGRSSGPRQTSGLHATRLS